MQDDAIATATDVRRPDDEAQSAVPIETNIDLDLIWGAKAIGAEISVSERRAFYLLERGAINGARKVLKTWCVARSSLRRQFLDAA